MSFGCNIENIPLDVVVVVFHVNASWYDKRLVHHRAVAHMLKVHLFAVIRPRAELHEALLHVEGKELHVYGTVTLVDGRRLPHYLTVVVNRSLRLQGNNEVPIGTGRRYSKEFVNAI